ncbi:hypothetical protein [Sphingobium sp. HWE2-09]|uniref:hypothetical protein n=1 Tax=Sphingobium sp. HWE2-09 TaxID=3108390 RepID=UPI002DC83297|nr:hypothetical protein [Sphingobium sp. HWE2-09]
MSELKNLSESPEAEMRRSTWQRVRMHRIGDRHLDTVELTVGLKAKAKTKAEERAALRRRAICKLMDYYSIPNTAGAIAAAIERLWTPRVHSDLGAPPHPSTIVRWRKLAGPGANNLANFMSVRRQRRGSN